MTLPLRAWLRPPPGCVSIPATWASPCPRPRRSTCPDASSTSCTTTHLKPGEIDQMRKEPKHTVYMCILLYLKRFFSFCRSSTIQENTRLSFTCKKKKNHFFCILLRTYSSRGLTKDVIVLNNEVFSNKYKMRQIIYRHIMKWNRLLMADSDCNGWRESIFSLSLSL